MNELLLKLFIKKHRNTESIAVHTAIGKLAGITGIVCNALLFAGKLITGLLAGSVSIVADAVNNLSDASSSVVTLLGFRIAQKPADKDHPYGHARYEYLSGLIVAGLVLIIGADMVKSSVEKIFAPTKVTISGATFAVLAVSVMVKAWMSTFFASLGKRINSITLHAASIDSRNDAIASAAVLLGCVVGYYFNVNMDGYMGAAVAVLILFSGVKLVKETVSPLLGKQADRELTDKIAALILSHDKILGIHDLLVHDYGPGKSFASVHAELSAEEDPLVCHDIIDDIECDVLEATNVHLVIHYDPVVENDEERNEMQRVMEEIINEIDPQLSLHDFRIVRGAEGAKLVFDLSVPYLFSQSRGELKKRIDKALTQQNRDYMTVIHFDGKA